MIDDQREELAVRPAEWSQTKFLPPLVVEVRGGRNGDRKRVQPQRRPASSMSAPWWPAFMVIMSWCAELFAGVIDACRSRGGGSSSPSRD